MGRAKTKRVIKNQASLALDLKQWPRESALTFTDFFYRACLLRASTRTVFESVGYIFARRERSLMESSTVSLYDGQSLYIQSELSYELGRVV